MGSFYRRSNKTINQSLIQGNVVPCTRDVIHLAIIRQQLNGTAPEFMHFSDSVSDVQQDALNFQYPVFGKVRDLNTKNNHVNDARNGFQGCRKCIPLYSNIIWTLSRMRHFKLA